MKKVLSVLLSCTIMTSLLIGCSSDDDKKYNELAQKIEELEKENEKLKEEKEDEGELEEKNEKQKNEKNKKSNTGNKNEKEDEGELEEKNKKSNTGNDNEEDDELGEFEKEDNEIDEKQVNEEEVDMTAIMEALGSEFNSQFDDFFAIDNTIVLRNCDYEDEDIKEYYDSLSEKEKEDFYKTTSYEIFTMRLYARMISDLIHKVYNADVEVMIEACDENERFYLIDSYGDTVDGLVKELDFDHDKYDVDIWYEDVFYWNKDLEEDDYTKEEYNEYLDELIEELGLN